MTECQLSCVTAAEGGQEPVPNRRRAMADYDGIISWMEDVCES